MTSTAGTPIFILGMLQRTGTNHLWDLLGLHPDTEVLLPVYEDHLVRCSAHLFDYVEEVSSFWTPDWEVPDAERDDLLRCLGDGVVQWLQGASGRRVVTKMPSVERADRFFELFPDCALVLLVRDGRSVCESAVKSFGWTYERAFRKWAAAAEMVLKVLADPVEGASMELVRYEELIDDAPATVRRVCATVGLDPDRYPYERIDALPVRGSSTLKDAGVTEMHWAPTERTEQFKPKERWQQWDPHTHRRFAQIAGRQQVALGYELAEVAGRDSLSERFGDVRDGVFDATYRETRVKLGRLRRGVRQTLRSH